MPTTTKDDQLEQMAEAVQRDIAATKQAKDLLAQAKQTLATAQYPHHDSANRHAGSLLQNAIQLILGRAIRNRTSLPEDDKTLLAEACLYLARCQLWLYRYRDALVSINVARVIQPANPRQDTLHRVIMAERSRSILYQANMRERAAAEAKAAEEAKQLESMAADLLKELGS